MIGILKKILKGIILTSLIFIGSILLTLLMSTGIVGIVIGFVAIFITLVIVFSQS